MGLAQAVNRRVYVTSYQRAFAVYWPLFSVIITLFGSENRYNILKARLQLRAAVFKYVIRYDIVLNTTHAIEFHIIRSLFNDLDA